MNFLIKTVFLFFIIVNILYSQTATITETKQKFRTYGFSDPSPIARMNNIYPYFRYDGFTDKPTDKEWKVVILENPYIKVFVTPEIGGKIWGAIEKSTGFPFIYYNNTVKFRDIAMRGPWTSGGIEFNFGDIGHTPATATPVDYMLKENMDGSVSCFVSSIDLPSRTTWVVEIKLEKDKAYFETKAFWYNSTEYNTSLYTWNNGAINSGDDLKLYYPGSNYIDHDGNLFPWPTAKNGKDISSYSENNFGTYKSYHVLGEYTNYFGAYYSSQNIGSGHASIYEDKPGKKIWIWGLSREGEIWTDLLTDKDLGNKQYVEIQTGMLYNQAIGNKTPFKHSAFEPGAVLKFDEIWFPFKNTNGISEANSYGVLNVIAENGKVKYSLCPLQKINSEIVITSNDKIIYQKNIQINPLETISDSVEINDKTKLKVIVGKNLIEYDSESKKERLLNRPNTSNTGFDWNSLYGKYLQSAENSRGRDYYNALIKSLEVLHADPNYLPALSLTSELYYRRMEYDKALDFAKRALQIDAYDVDANYWFGIISKKMNNYYDALDAFGVASRSMKYKSVAYQNIAEIYFVKKDYNHAKEFCNRSIEYNKRNISSLKLKAVIARFENDTLGFVNTLNDIENINPLEHFIRSEKYLQSKKNDDLDLLKKYIRCELPREEFLEMGAYYYNIGLYDDAALLLKSAPENAIVDYWLAGIYYKKNDYKNGNYYLNKATSSAIDFVFPFRPETYDLLQYSKTHIDNWKTDYYTALILWHKGRNDEAAALFNKCGNLPESPAFYITRANYFKDTNTDKAYDDYRKAVEIDKNNWRAWHNLIGYLNNNLNYSEALTAAKKAKSLFKKSYIAGFDYAKTLMFNEKYEDCIDELEEINLLPSEGARDGHDVYRASYIMLSIEKIRKNKFKDAVKLLKKSMEWPENLGAGKPYDFDTRIELFLESLCYDKLNDKTNYEKIIKLFDQVSEKYKAVSGVNNLITSIVLKKRGDLATGEILLNEWNKKQNDEISEWASKQYKSNTLIPVETKSWFILKNDYNFRLIYEIMKSGIIK